MTIGEIFNDFKIRVDKVDSSAYPNLTIREIEFIFNAAQDQLIKTRFTGNNFRKKGFEQDNKRIEDLRPLIINTSYVITDSDYDSDMGCYIVDKPGLKADDYYIFIKDYINLFSPSCNRSQIISIKTMQHDDYSKAASNPFRKPKITGPLKLNTSNFMELYFGEKVDLNTYRIRYHLTYVKKPDKISYGTDGTSQFQNLPDILINELIDIAVLHTLEEVEQPRTQSYSGVRVVTNE